MGDPAEAARILGSVQTILCHRVNTPEEVIALAGTRRRTEASRQFSAEGATGAGSAREQHQFKIDPNHVRALPAGEAFVISQGRAMRVRVAQAPDVIGDLPGQQDQQPPAACPARGIDVGTQQGPCLPF